MNNWKAVGGIFWCMGIILFIAGCANGFAAANSLDQTILGQYITQQQKGMLFWNAAQIYLISGVLAFVVGSVGLYAGRDSDGVVETPSSPNPIRVDTEAPSVMNNESKKVVYPDPKVICSVCGTVNDSDAVYCKNCSNRTKTRCGTCGTINGLEAIYCKKCANRLR
jgi:hypothetical protein